MLLGVSSGPRASAGPTPRSARADEYAALLAWLDGGLRAGRVGRLAAEYPSALRTDRFSEHSLVELDGRLAAHAWGRRLVARAGGRSVPIGLIGLVYTDPIYRGRGLASRCVEHAVAGLARRGAELVLLWSDLERFYRGLGFVPAGREWLLAVDRALCRRAGGGAGLVVSPARGEDGEAMEALYRAKPSGAKRSADELARLLTIPDSRALVARRRKGRGSGAEIVAYAVCGRGDDFPGVVHEWAGEASGVLACLETLCLEHPVLGVIAGPEREAPVEALRAAGAAAEERAFGWVRLTHPGRLWKRLSAGDARLNAFRLEEQASGLQLVGPECAYPLSHAQAVSILLGGVEAESLASLPISKACRSLPWPLFLWGFDSI